MSATVVPIEKGAGSLQLLGCGHAQCQTLEPMLTCLVGRVTAAAVAAHGQERGCWHHGRLTDGLTDRLTI